MTYNALQAYKKGCLNSEGKLTLDEIIDDQGPLLIILNEATSNLLTFPDRTLEIQKNFKYRKNPYSNSQYGHAWAGVINLVNQLNSKHKVHAILNLGNWNSDTGRWIRYSYNKLSQLPLVRLDAYKIKGMFTIIDETYKINGGFDKSIPIFGVLGDSDEYLIKQMGDKAVDERWQKELKEQYHRKSDIPPEIVKNIDLDMKAKYVKRLRSVVPALDKSILENPISNEIEIEGKVIKFQHDFAGKTRLPLAAAFERFKANVERDLLDYNRPDLIIQGHRGTHEFQSVVYSLREYVKILQAGVFEDPIISKRLAKEKLWIEPSNREQKGFNSYGISIVELSDMPNFIFANLEFLEKLGKENFNIYNMDYLSQLRQSDHHIGLADTVYPALEQSITDAINKHIDQIALSGDIMTGNGSVYREFWIESVGNTTPHVLKRMKEHYEQIIDSPTPENIAENLEAMDKYLKLELEERHSPSLEKQLYWTYDLFFPLLEKVRKESRLEKNGIIVITGNHPRYTVGRTAGFYPEKLIGQMYYERVKTLEEEVECPCGCGHKFAQLKPKPEFIALGKTKEDDTVWGDIGYYEADFGLPGGFNYLELFMHKVRMVKGLSSDRQRGVDQWLGIRPIPRKVMTNRELVLEDRFTGFSMGHYHYNSGAVVTKEIKNKDGTKKLLTLVQKDPGSFMHSNAYAAMLPKPWEDCTVGDQIHYLPKDGYDNGLIIAKIRLSEALLPRWQEARKEEAEWMLRKINEKLSKVNKE